MKLLTETKTDPEWKMRGFELNVRTEGRERNSIGVLESLQIQQPHYYTHIQNCM